MGSEAAPAKDLPAWMAELRLEGTSVTSVHFSDPCSVCGSKKRRCLNPPTRYRKKVLVFDQEGAENAAAATKSPSLSTPDRGGSKKRSCCHCCCFICGTPTSGTPSPAKPPTWACSSPGSTKSMRSTSQSPPLASPFQSSPFETSPLQNSPVGSAPLLVRCSGRAAAAPLPASPPRGSLEKKEDEGGFVATPDRAESSGKVLKPSDAPPINSPGTTAAEAQDSGLTGSAKGKKAAGKENCSGSKKREELRVSVSCKCGVLHEILF